MRVQHRSLLPAEYKCNACGHTKPIAEMVVVYQRREKVYRLKPRCKECHNRHERGHRREWKRKYLQRWRSQNHKLNESYWREDPDRKEKMRIAAARRLSDQDYRDAVSIQRRLNKRGMGVSLKEAKELLKRFGPCYPSPSGLTQKGRRECERIRSQLRSRGSKRISIFEIRLMVYEDGHYIKPARQKRPYQAQSKTLRQWWQKKRQASVENQ